MNQKNPTIELRKLVDDDSPYGNDQGQATQVKLKKELSKYPQSKIIGISLKGIKRTDASFPRESVVSLVKEKCGEIGFYLKDFANDDMIDNWNYAARAKEQPIVVFTNKEFKVIGPELSADTYKLLDFVMKKQVVTTSLVAEEFGYSAPNASMKLKKLKSQGLIIGNKETAVSGGLEYVFTAIK